MRTATVKKIGRLFVFIFLFFLISCSSDGFTSQQSIGEKLNEHHSIRPEAPVDYSYTLSKGSGGEVLGNRDYVVCISKDPEKDFVILNLSDTHVTDSEDFESVANVVGKLIEYKKPDLITVTGDLTEFGTEKYRR